MTTKPRKLERPWIGNPDLAGACPVNAGQCRWLRFAGLILLAAGLAAAAESPAPPPAAATPRAEQAARLPKLLDLGASKCIPCKRMAPILEELKGSLAGQLEVVFIDVWKDRTAGETYGIEAIPTQIFYDAQGIERFRHVGFLGRAEILAKWKELGVSLTPAPPPTPPPTPPSPGTP